MDRTVAPLWETCADPRITIDRAHDPRPIALELGAFTATGFRPYACGMFSAAEARALAARLHELADEAGLPADA
jgi:hypothetical protein